MATYYVDGSVAKTPAWQAEHSYSAGNIVTPILDGGADNKYVYECTDAGTSGVAEPSWDATVGNNTVEDTGDDVTWICRAPDSWGKALSSLQGAADLAVAGDIVYCRGTQTMTATIDFDANAGNQTNGFIKFIGCNDAGNVDGTRFKLDANAGSYHCITHAAIADQLWFQNIECKHTNAGNYDGWNAAASGIVGCVFINCCANTVGRTGFNYSTYLTNSIIYRCLAYTNGGSGFSIAQESNRHLLCFAYGNTAAGFYYGVHLLGCVSHANADGVDSAWSQYGTAMNCVFDANTDDGYAISSTSTLGCGLIFGCRITNNTASGLNCNSETVLCGYSYFEDNGDNIEEGTTNLFNFIPIETGNTTTNAEDTVGETTDGYVNQAADDFSTNYVSGTDPTLRRTAILLPVA